MKHHKEEDTPIPRKPKVKRGYWIIPSNPDEVQVRAGTWSGKFYVFFDDKKRGIYAKLFSLLDGKHSIEDIKKFLGTEHEEEINEVLREGRKLGIIQEVEEIEEPSTISKEELEAYGHVVAYLDLLPQLAGSQQFLQRLRKASITVVGGGAVGSELTMTLSRMGIGRIMILDNMRVTAEDVHISPFYDPKNIGRYRADILKEKIVQSTDAFVDVSCHIETLDEDILLEALRTTDLLVVAEDLPHYALYETVNELSLRTKAVWSIITIDGCEGIAGPTFIPHETACYDCYRLRLESNLKGYEEYIKFKEHLINNYTKVGRRFIGLTSFADILAGIYSADIPFIILEKTGFTVGRAVYIDFLDFSIHTDDVLKLPMCPSCGRNARGYVSHKLYAMTESLRDLKTILFEKPKSEES